MQYIKVKPPIMHNIIICARPTKILSPIQHAIERNVEQRISIKQRLRAFRILFI